MKFDCIIMNPPYSKNLHLKILAEAITHLKNENSKCVNLSPINIWKDPYKEYKSSNKSFLNFKETVLAHVESIEPFDSIEATNLFGAGINQDLGIYVAKSNVPNMFDCSLLYDKKCINIVKKVLDHVNFKGIVSSLSKKYKDISKKSNFIALQYICGGSGRDVDYVKFHSSFIRYNTFFANGKNPNGKTLDSLHTSTTGNINDWAVITFNTAIESENFWKISTTNFFKFLFANTLVDVNVHPEFLPWVGDCVNPSTGLKGYKSEWTDEDFYKYFNITKKEQKVIEDTMAQYK